MISGFNISLQISGTKKAIIIAFFVLCATVTRGQADTVRIMAYNVLYYGDRPACQGPHSNYHNYLKTIVAYGNPDILGLEKVAAFPLYTGDNSGSAPIGFADSILRFALDAAFTSRYAYCNSTNVSGADNMSLLFYNKNKFGFAGIVASYVNVTDFNTYKLYYKTSRLTLGDTIFLYVTLNHTQSGSSASTRNGQLAGEMSQLSGVFSSLPNVVNMGDFNFHNSSESGYQTLVAPANAGFAFSDPPFTADATYTYPADWDNNPDDFAACLTTSTRLSSSIPNSCGTSGGGKSWYDHIFFSAPIMNGNLRMRYLPHSYRTIGNDGGRVGISINDAPANTSVPAAVIGALFQMSNKYPVMASVLVDSSGVASVRDATAQLAFSVGYPVTDQLQLKVTKAGAAHDITIVIVDMAGRIVTQYLSVLTGNTISMPFGFARGIYGLVVYSDNTLAGKTLFIK